MDAECMDRDLKLSLLKSVGADPHHSSVAHTYTHIPSHPLYQVSFLDFSHIR